MVVLNLLRRRLVVTGLLLSLPPASVLGQRMRTLRPGTDQLPREASQIFDEHRMMKLVTGSWHSESSCATKKG